MKKDWEIKTLGEVLKLEYGKPLPESDRKADGKFPAFGANGIKTRTDRFYYEKPSIIVGRKGSAGEVTLVEGKFWPLDVTYYVTFNDKKYVLEYLFLLLKCLDLQKLATGVKPGINRNEVYGIQVEIPPLSEQKRIVKILDEKFGVIEELKKVTEQQIVDVKELFEIRLGLIFESLFLENDTCVMSDIYDVRDGTHDSPKYQTDGYPLITSKNLKEGELLMENIKYISESDYLEIRKRSGVSKGDVLFAMIGTIGNPVVIKQEPNFAIKNVALFKVSKKQNSNFLRYYLISRCVIDKMKNEAKGATQQFVGLGYLRLFPIPCVDLNIQNKIVKELDELSNKTKELAAIFDKKISDLEELKKSYLEQAFSGEL